MNPLKSYGLQTKSVTTRTKMTTPPLLRCRQTHDLYVSTMRGLRLKEQVSLYDEGTTMQRIYTRGLHHYKELSIVVIPC